MARKRPAPTRRAVVAAGLVAPLIAQAATRSGNRIVPFEASAFPYRGLIPGTDTPFLDVQDGSRRGHTSPRGGVYWEDPTYSDRSVLLSVPPGFDPARPARIVLYFHGNRVRLERDVVNRQGLPRQLAASRLNAVLVAPQLALDALDSSAGHFWEPGFAAQFLNEAVRALDRAFGTGTGLAGAPVVILAYSGGYLPAAFTASVGGLQDRLAALVLLDALYGEADRFFQIITSRGRMAVLSAFGPSTRQQNQALRTRLSSAGIPVTDGLPATLSAGLVAFHDAGPAVHDDFVTRAWTADPVRAVLDRIPGAPRR